MAFRGCTKMTRADAPQIEASNPLSTRTINVASFENLEHFVTGATTEITQIERGQLQGSISHLTIAGLPFDFGTFSLGLRSRGVVSADQITIGMLTGCSDRVIHGAYEMQPGDVVVLPPGAERNARYYGGASLAVISLTVSDLDSLFGSESRLREPRAWSRNRYRPIGHTGPFAIRSLRNIVSRLKAEDPALSTVAAEFCKHAVVEIMTEAILENSPADTDGPAFAVRNIVGKVEDYIEINEARPIHLAEICSRLRVSRRALHRAFHDVLGLGPSAFLRRKRLCSVCKILRSSDPAITTVADIALQHGFVNLGRFSGEYRCLFDEYPSQTLSQSHRRLSLSEAT